MDDDESVGTVEHSEYFLDCLAEVAIIMTMEESRDHFRVCLSIKHISVSDQSLFQFMLIFNNTVVDDPSTLGRIMVRMGILFIDTTMGGSTSMSDTQSVDLASPQPLSFTERDISRIMNFSF